MKKPTVKVKNDKVVDSGGMFFSIKNSIKTYTTQNDYDLDKVRDVLKNATKVKFISLNKQTKRTKALKNFEGGLEESKFLLFANVIAKREVPANSALLVEAHNEKDLEINTFFVSDYFKALKEERKQTNVASEEPVQ